METGRKLSPRMLNHIYERDKKNRFDDDETDFDFDSSSINLTREFRAADFILGTELISQVLRSYLKLNVANKPWIINRSNIIQNAIVNLARGIFNTPLPDYLKEGSLSELMDLAEGLTKVTTGEARRAKVLEKDDFLDLDFYYYNSLGETRRLVAYFNFVSRISEFSNKEVRPFCQIRINNIIGRSERGKAIAGDDSRIRCGLRTASYVKNLGWSVSIDSGADNPNPHEDGPKNWRTIRPLSQAIKIAREYPESGIDPNEPTLHTFHHYDINSLQADPDINFESFAEFNYLFSRLLLEN